MYYVRFDTAKRITCWEDTILITYEVRVYKKHPININILFAFDNDKISNTMQELYMFIYV